MSNMSDLAIMIRDGARTTTDFEHRGESHERAKVLARIVERSNVGPVDRMLGKSKLANDVAAERVGNAFGHGPGCYGECDGLYDCS